MILAPPSWLLLHRLIAAPVLVLVTVMGIAACHGEPDSSPPSTIPNTTVPTESQTATPVSDRDAIEAAYTRFTSLSSDLDRQYPQEQWRQVFGEVATDPALTTVLANITAQREGGVTTYGELIPHVSDVSIDGDQATLRDCQDGSHAGQADAATGERRTVGVEHAPVVAELVRGEDGMWRVSHVEYIGGECS